MLVADVDQSIYQFRNARPDMLVKLAESAGNPKSLGPRYELFVLDANYRSGAVICGTANKLIEHNKNRVAKYTVAVSGCGSVEAHQCKTPIDEACFISRGISELCDDTGKTEPQDIAVLTRTNALAKEIADHLKSAGIPVATVEQPPRPSDWRQAKLLLTVLANPWNDLAVLQLIRSTEGEAEARTLREAAAVRMVGVNEILDWRYGKGDTSLDLDLNKHGLSAESRQMVHDYARELGRRGPWSLNDLLVYVGQQESAARTVGEGVTCCTLHAAKGKEWSVVFLPAFEEGTIPSAKDAADQAALEESRRLAFVGLTRAKDRAVFTWCSERPESRGPNLPPGPMRKRTRSRFIAEAGM